MTSPAPTPDTSVVWTPQSPETPDLAEPQAATGLEAERRVSREAPGGPTTAPLDEAGPDAPAPPAHDRL